MILKLLREGLGRIFLFFEWLTRPKSIERTPEAQQQVDAETQSMLLYQFYACPFCIKTRRTIHQLNLKIETRNAERGSPFRQELETGGGTVQVPCLRLKEPEGDIWMYESSEIIAYLEQRFSDR